VNLETEEDLAHEREIAIARALHDGEEEQGERNRQDYSMYVD
jgi:hypothetical protein